LAVFVNSHKGCLPFGWHTQVFIPNCDVGNGQMLLIGLYQTPAAAVSTSAVYCPSIDVPPFVYSFLNVRSLGNKLDGGLECVRDNHVSEMCLAVTWLDVNCSVLGRMWSFVDRPRPRLRQDLSVNHGRLLVFLSAPVHLMTVLPFPWPPTFELCCVGVSSGRLS
jgi:hypothetical protein